MMEILGVLLFLLGICFLLRRKKDYENHDNIGEREKSVDSHGSRNSVGGTKFSADENLSNKYEEKKWGKLPSSTQNRRCGILREGSEDFLYKRYRIKYLYHITHKDNLESILRNGGIYAYDVLMSNGIKKVNIADPDVMDKRIQKRDPIFNIFITSYVGLYFNPKNPMLFCRRSLQDYLLILGIDKNLLYDRGTIFADGNATSHTTNFYSSVEFLDRLNWDCIWADFWNRFEDGKRLRMAEVLVRGIVPIDKIRVIYCNNEETLSYVKEVLDRLHSGQINVFLNKKFFF